MGVVCSLRQAMTRWGAALLLVFLSAVAGTAILWGYTAEFPGHKQFPYWLAPSAMWAAGNGLYFPEAMGAEADAFLKQERESLDPAFLRDAVPVPLGDLHVTHRYMLLAAGVAWRTLGISWNSFRVLMLVFYCATAAALYAVFRLGMGRMLSLAGAMWFMLSPGVLNELGNLRDFSRAFFIYLSIAVMGMLIKRGVERRSLIMGAVGLGLVMGIGLGFRQDIVTCVPPALAVLLLAAPARRAVRLHTRVAVAGLFLLTFVLAGLPIFLGMMRFGPTTAHHVLGGFAAHLEEELGSGGASYQHLALCNDRFIHATAASYAERVAGVTGPIPFMSNEAADASGVYMRRLILQFPADMLTRAYAAVLYVLRGAGRFPYPEQLCDPYSTAVAAMDGVIGAFNGAILVGIACAVLLAMSAVDPRRAWTLLFAILYFCGYISVQFQPRHSFYHFFLPLWLAGLALSGLLGAVRRFLVRRKSAETGQLLIWRRVAARVILFATCVLCMLLAPLAAVRHYQANQVTMLNRTYANAAIEEVPTVRTVKGNWSYFQPVAPVTGLDHAPYAEFQEPWRFYSAYLVAVFDGAPVARSFWLQYDRDLDGDDFTQPIEFASTGAGGETRVFFPVYDTVGDPGQGLRQGWIRFRGIVVRAAYAKGFRGLYRVAAPSELPLQLEWCSPSDPDMFHPYQVLMKPTPPSKMVSNPWLSKRWYHEQAAGSDPADAIRTYEDADSFIPGDLEVLNALATVCGSAGRAWHGIMALQCALQLQPAFQPLYAKLDQIARLLDALDDRIALWESVAREHDGVVHAHVYHACALLDAARVTDAAAALARAAALAPGDLALQHAAQSLAAWCTGDASSAISLMRESVKVCPSIESFGDFLKRISEPPAT